MLRLPRGVSPAPGRGGTALPAPPPHHHPKKVMSLMGSCDLGASSLGSPPLSTGCFTQVYTPAAVSGPAPRGGCLCDTPQSPEFRTLCSASAGRLPVRYLHPVSSSGIASGEAEDGAGWGARGSGGPKHVQPSLFQVLQLILECAPCNVSFWGGGG